MPQKRTEGVNGTEAIWKQSRGNQREVYSNSSRNIRSRDTKMKDEP